MFTHNFDPVLLDFGIIAVRWYSLSYIFGILIGWWYGKKIITRLFGIEKGKSKLNLFDDLITYLIVSLVVGGRLGYVFFYNFSYYLSYPLDIFKIWEGGMSFHGALIGIIVGTFLFSYLRKIKTLIFLDIIACVSPIGIFFGRIANFINGELVGKATTVPWAVVFPNVDQVPRHPSQLYEAFFEGLILFFLLNVFMSKQNYEIGKCSYMFLILYGVFRIISEFFREPDAHIGYFFGIFSTGMILSIIMVIAGLMMLNFLKKNEN